MSWESNQGDPYFPIPSSVEAPPFEQFEHDLEQIDWGSTQLPLTQDFIIYRDFMALPSVSTVTESGTCPSTPSEFSGPSIMIASEYSIDPSQLLNDGLSFGPLPPSTTPSPVHMDAYFYPDSGTNFSSQETAPPVQQMVSPCPSPPSPEIPPQGKLDASPRSRPAKIHRCPICGHVSERKHNLKTHMETHNPNRSKPYVCHYETCRWRFTRKHDLKRHFGTKHRIRDSGNPPSDSMDIVDG
ncbi:hypothetical protein BGW80DRAFT_1457493 [Lactifluus volemus]|nr:hypothetical protein BGW80DRAFT_1457493 [Lactifluus volemus]